MVVNLVTSIISSTHKWVPAGVINGLFSSLRSMVIEFSIILSKVVVKGQKYQEYRPGWECTIIQCQWNTTFKRIKTPKSTFEMAVSAYTRWLMTICAETTFNQLVQISDDNCDFGSFQGSLYLRGVTRDTVTSTTISCFGWPLTINSQY